MERRIMEPTFLRRWAVAGMVTFVAGCAANTSGGGTGALASDNGPDLTNEDSATCPPIVVLTGDLNCDGLLNAFDIEPLTLALTDRAGYESAYPCCDLSRADCNHDGVVSPFDIEACTALLAGPPDDGNPPPICTEDACGPRPLTPARSCGDGTWADFVCERIGGGPSRGDAPVCAWNYHECAPCSETACGPRPLLPAVMCADGTTYADFVCERVGAGPSHGDYAVCAWNYHECPLPPPSCPCPDEYLTCTQRPCDCPSSEGCVCPAVVDCVCSIADWECPIEIDDDPAAV